MAADLAITPVSGLSVQACGDAHLSNFGVFASPERRLVFDVNDFDETMPGPWEWDVKRLAASLEVAARGRGSRPRSGPRSWPPRSRGTGRRCAMFAGHERPRRLVRARRRRGGRASSSRASWTPSSTSGSTRAWPRRAPGTACRQVAKLTREVDGQPRIISDPPLLIPIDELIAERVDRAEFVKQLTGLIGGYRRSLQTDRKYLLERFEFVRHGPQGGRGGQRRDPLLDHPAARPGRRRPAVPAGQGGRGVGARAISSAPASTATRASGWSPGSG